MQITRLKSAVYDGPSASLEENLMLFSKREELRRAVAIGAQSAPRSHLWLVLTGVKVDATSCDERTPIRLVLHCRAVLEQELGRLMAGLIVRVSPSFDVDSEGLHEHRMGDSDQRI